MAEIKLYPAKSISTSEWLDLQTLQHEAFSQTLDRSEAEVDVLVGRDDPAGFVRSHQNPNAEVGGRFYANQAYTRPRVAVATDANKLVGFAYSAHNVSGSNLVVRQAKRMALKKNYLWLREVAVSPEHTRQGVAKDLGRTILSDGFPQQPVSAYIWPDEIDFLQGTLERIGFVNTGEQPVDIFGSGEEVTQVRMQAPSAREVLANLR